MKLKKLNLAVIKPSSSFQSLSGVIKDVTAGEYVHCGM